MENKLILACDIAKEKLDWFCLDFKEFFTIKNDKDGLKELLKWFKTKKISKKDVRIIFEHTGSYGSLLEKFCSENEITYYKVPAMEIKLSSGIKRGKSDSIDAEMIANYFFEKSYKLKESKPDSKTVQRIKQLKATRDNMVKHKASLKCSLKNYSEVLRLPKNDLIIKAYRRQITTFENSIKKIELEIEDLITEEKEIFKNYKLLLTITGVGKVIALDIILATDNFRKFKVWREYASYCGCAPYPNSSGKFIGKNRISHYAAKELKANLTSGAKSAMNFDFEMVQYKNKKLEQGKSIKCITNNVRCKLIARMFSVVKNQSEYKKNYTHNLVMSES